MDYSFSLKKLYLNGNKIRSVPKELIVSISALEELSVANNLLTVIPEEWMVVDGGVSHQYKDIASSGVFKVRGNKCCIHIVGNNLINQ